MLAAAPARAAAIAPWLLYCTCRPIVRERHVEEHDLAPRFVGALLELVEAAHDEHLRPDPPGGRGNAAAQTQHGKIERPGQDHLDRFLTPDPVRHTLAALKTTRLDGLDACLDTAASNKTLSEWEFLLPLGRGGITSRALSDLFARHARTADERHYAQDLAGLPSQALAGMLTGYIDRLVRTDGHWGVVDWKSNYLGSRVADYSGQALWRCAARQHYLLQLHFYLVALRRYLRLYDSGGTVVSGSLLFVRGVHPGTSQGVLEITPSEPLLDELDRLFASPDRSVPS